MRTTLVKAIDEKSDYSDAFLKLIPGEVVGTYIAIDKIIPVADPLAKWASLVVAIVLLFAIPFYLRRLAVANWLQIIFTMIAFVIWLYTLGGPFVLWATALGVSLYVPWIGSILLILWTALIPFVFVARPSRAPVQAT